MSIEIIVCKAFFKELNNFIAFTDQTQDSIIYICMLNRNKVNSRNLTSTSIVCTCTTMSYNVIQGSPMHALVSHKPHQAML